MEKYTEIKNKWEKYLIFGIIFGIIIHGMIIFNNLPNGDGFAFNYYTWQNTVISARWFLGIACLISGPFTIPTVNGVLAIFFITVSAILIISIFDIKLKINRIIVIMFMLSFPALAAGMLYMFTIDGYTISIFLSVLAVWSLHKKSTYIACIESALCIAFSMGIYQAYISVTMTLCMLYIMQMVLLDKKDIIKKAIQFLFSGVLGAVIYFILLKIILRLTHTKLSTYQGIARVGKKFGLFDIIIRIKTIYVQTIATIMNKLFINKSLAIICIVMSLIIIFELYKKFQSKKLLIFVIGMMLIPICLLPVYMTSTDVYYHLVMKYSFVLLFVYFIVLMEYLNINKIINRILIVGLFGIVYSFIVSNNSMYEYASMRYDRTLLLANRIENQLETGSYNLSKPIGIFYEGVNDENYKVVSDIYPYSNRKYIDIKGYNIKIFMKQYFTSKFKYINTDEKWEEIRKSEEYHNLKLDNKSFKVKETKDYIIVKVRSGVNEDYGLDSLNY